MVFMIPINFDHRREPSLELVEIQADKRILQFSFAGSKVDKPNTFVSDIKRIYGQILVGLLQRRLKLHFELISSS